MGFNHVMDLLFWLVGFLHVLGCLGGLAMVACAVWLCCSQRGKAIAARLHLDEEYRCRECTAVGYCEAAYTGVCYPCAHFEAKENRP